MQLRKKKIAVLESSKFKCFHTYNKIPMNLIDFFQSSVYFVSIWCVVKARMCICVSDICLWCACACAMCIRFNFIYLLVHLFIMQFNAMRCMCLVTNSCAFGKQFFSASKQKIPWLSIGEPSNQSDGNQKNHLCEIEARISWKNIKFIEELTLIHWIYWNKLHFKFWFTNNADWIASIHSTSNSIEKSKNEQ